MPITERHAKILRYLIDKSIEIDGQRVCQITQNELG